MKRNLKLLTLILEYAEQQISPGDPGCFPIIEGYGSAEILYHVELCAQAGFVDLAARRGMKDRPLIKQLTWTGHEWLDGPATSHRHPKGARSVPLSRA